MSEEQKPAPHASHDHLHYPYGWDPACRTCIRFKEQDPAPHASEPYGIWPQTGTGEPVAMEPLRQWYIKQDFCHCSNAQVGPGSCAKCDEELDALRVLMLRYGEACVEATRDLVIVVPARIARRVLDEGTWRK